MNYDELINCSRCGSDASYRQEISKEISIELCYGCGFQSNSVMLKGSTFFDEQWGVLPELYKVLIEEEENGKIWVPSHINVKGKGMIFADGNSKENWMWAGVKYIPVSGDETDEKYKDVEWKPDMTTIRHYGERDFMEALSYIGVLPE
tara:strand:+ start:669 stop:1112 length:444 start_codon:yes stop_codon:yes gene_type:complete